MQLSRRKLLAGAAPVAALAIAGCTSAQIATAQADWANFIDQVNALLAKGCGLLPGFVAAANSIEAIATVLYPTVAAAIAAGVPAVTAVANTICSAVPAAPAPQLALKLKANTAKGIASFVGNVTINGKVIPVTGYSVQ